MSACPGEIQPWEWMSLVNSLRPITSGRHMEMDTGKGRERSQAKIGCDELCVIDESPADKAGRSHKVRVVRWVVDGVKQTPKLEKRGFYKGRKSGDTLTGDIEPLTLDDLRKVAAKLPAILDTMEQGVFA